MPGLLNHTPFAARLGAAIDSQSTPLDIVFVAATFEIPPGSAPRPVDDQPPVPLVDIRNTEDASSSIRYEGEIGWHKPYVDILVNGSACSRGGRPVEAVEVRLRLGTIDKRLLVTGDRTWGRPVGGPTRPEPFTSMPIVYERAFGGTVAAEPNKFAMDDRNPVGIGFEGAVSADPGVKSRLPNVEYIDDRMSAPSDRIRPAGFGIISRAWQPRLRYAGTYDNEWLTGQCPLLPLDFDPRYFQSAPADQQIAAVNGGENVVIDNMRPEGSWHFRLPQLDVPLRVCAGRRILAGRMRVDTVLLEPDHFRVTMLLRAGLPERRNAKPVDEFVVGHVSPAWEHARRRDKTFVDLGQTAGALRGARHFLA